MNLAACVCIGPCWLGPLAMCRRIQCLLDAIPLWAVLRGRRWCQCSRQVILPRLHSALPPAWPCCSESGSLRIGVRVGSELSGSQRCWGFGHSPGSCPTKEPRRGGIGRGNMFPWELDGRHHVQHAGMGFPASWGLLLVYSTLLPPRQHPQTSGSYFPTLLPPPPPRPSLSHQEAITKSLELPFPEHFSQGVLQGCCDPSPAPHHSLPGAPFLPAGEGGDGITPPARSCPSRSPPGAQAEPSSVPPAK